MKRPTRSQGRLLRRPLGSLRRLSKTEKTKIGRKSGGAYDVAKDTAKVTRQTPVITASAWRDAQVGVPHGRAARLRKEKKLGYGPQGLSERAPQSVRTRIRLAKPQYEQSWQHAYINTDGEASYDFSGSMGCGTCRIISMPSMTRSHLTMELVCFGSSASRS
jgi:hypothetical protein